MSDNNGCGVGLALLAILTVMVLVVAIGGPVVTGDGLSWDSSAAIARTNARLEAERLRTQAETRQAIEREETARIMSDNMMVTIQWLAVAGALVGVVFVAGWAVQRSVTAWAARPHRPATVQRIAVRMSFDQARLLAQPHLLAMPDARLEWVEEDDIRGWAVVDDRLQIVRPLQLTESQRPAQPAV